MEKEKSLYFMTRCRSKSDKDKFLAIAKEQGWKSSAAMLLTVCDLILEGKLVIGAPTTPTITYNQ